MKLSYPTLRCANCGTEFKPTNMLEYHGDHGAPECPCPVCQFPVIATAATELQPSLTISDFEAQLSALLAEARAGGITPDEIVPVLRDELEFTAELAHVGRRLVVQIMDLGPDETMSVTLPVRDRREMLLSRGVAQ